jgi:hypothetical protein
VRAEKGEEIPGFPRHALADVTQIIAGGPGAKELKQFMPGGDAHPCLQHPDPRLACGCFWKLAHE